ncbi:MAG: ribonuclease [Oscillospiraceae bacterium]|nr:ribonuclease [Oscillospiraceae bacterium]
MKKRLALLLAALTLFLSACTTISGISEKLGSVAETPPIATLPVAAAPQTAEPTATPAPVQESDAPQAPTPSQEEDTLPEDGIYDSKEEVALYLHLYGHLPDNYITKKEAEALGWPGGSLEPYAPGMCIGGNRFGNYEGLLPEAKGRTYTECDIDTMGAEKRGAKRIVFSNDGLIYYTDDHYKSFTLLYGEA